MIKRVYFFRSFRGFSGGHLKVRHYFDHINATPGYTAQIYFDPESTWGPENPWIDLHTQVMPQWHPEEADILFLAGLDWLALSPAQRTRPPVPVINLIQHVRHADPHDPRYAFLQHPAMRICVSQEVASAIAACQQVSTPIWSIPNGIDLPSILTTEYRAAQRHNVLIAGLKNPALARVLAAKLEAVGVDRVAVLTDAVPRAQYLTQIARSQVVLLLPHQQEGFYLPALEAMALGCTVVCPDCVGNRSFCVDGHNCFRPVYNEQALLDCTQMALRMSDAARSVMRGAAVDTAQRHSLAQERLAFQKALGTLSTVVLAMNNS